ncbi:DNA-directed RNA polymeras-like protein III 25 kDa polypeptide [Lophiotrema nucula]|uniref:DNA-directed RNA polymerase subunit n=1 Tax=Lophiotrema nucula TaxID=690887 RepID=A0A6A5YK39_9PLEO|nr:DNA-directed RNA polymeras-like protein III 25 kDa polypeptide [Lophiotrema nucula]
MFILTTIQDLIQIAPPDFHKPSPQAIKDAINAKYANKVVLNIGLCICMWDLLSSSEGLIGHGTGLVNVNVEFRIAVFRPFRGEIVKGRIGHSTQEGIWVGLNFTNEVFVPFQNLFENSHFEEGERVWVWDSEGTELFFDKGETVLFRVEQEEWIDQKPGIVQKDENGNVIEERGTAWRLIGSMAQPGLGPTLWWGDQEEGEEQEGGGEQAMVGEQEVGGELEDAGEQGDGREDVDEMVVDGA